VAWDNEIKGTALFNKKVKRLKKMDNLGIYLASPSGRINPTLFRPPNHFPSRHTAPDWHIWSKSRSVHAVLHYNY
jgi:hypothetical protein